MDRFAYKLHQAVNAIKPGKTSGFTLVELAIVLSIIGILAAIAVPQASSWLETRDVFVAAEDLEGALQQAKLLALQQSTNCSVTFDPGTNTYTNSITNHVVNLDRYRGEVQITDDPDPTDPVITFTPQGVCNPFGAVYFTNAAKVNRVRIRVTAAGGISTHVWSEGGWR